jgi:hypothetical protein
MLLDTSIEQHNSVFAQIVFNLIADSRLENPFTIEQCIDVLLQPSLTPHRGLLYEVYCSLYRQKYADNAPLLAQVAIIEQIFASVAADADAANIVVIGEQLTDIVESCSHIKIVGDAYQLMFMHA